MLHHSGVPLGNRFQPYSLAVFYFPDTMWSCKLLVSGFCHSSDSMALKFMILVFKAVMRLSNHLSDLELVVSPASETVTAVMGTFSKEKLLRYVWVMGPPIT